MKTDQAEDMASDQSDVYGGGDERVGIALGVLHEADQDSELYREASDFLLNLIREWGPQRDKDPRKLVSVSSDFFEHLLNCMANCKPLREDNVGVYRRVYSQARDLLHKGIDPDDSPSSPADETDSSRGSASRSLTVAVMVKPISFNDVQAACYEAINRTFPNADVDSMREFSRMIGASLGVPVPVKVPVNTKPAEATEHPEGLCKDEACCRIDPVPKPTRDTVRQAIGFDWFGPGTKGREIRELVTNRMCELFGIE